MRASSEQPAHIAQTKREDNPALGLMLKHASPDDHTWLFSTIYGSSSLPFRIPYFELFLDYASTPAFSRYMVIQCPPLDCCRIDNYRRHQAAPNIRSVVVLVFNIPAEVIREANRTREPRLCIQDVNIVLGTHINWFSKRVVKPMLLALYFDLEDIVSVMFEERVIETAGEEEIRGRKSFEWAY